MPKDMSGVMHEFSEGKLHSGSSSGPTVKNRKQAIAIGLSEQRQMGKHIPPPKEHQMGHHSPPHMHHREMAEHHRSLAHHHDALADSMHSVGSGSYDGY